ncbi:ATP-binding protein [Prevotella fusca]|uniref:ATP-binding protein n=1 Tax=Prevotella fusca JCM 17724 TaxID=1236517 RepID=A0ABX7XWW8_9BACT|nr:ATP-binding protein [Prevotella fusca]QUB85927.1 ATP-binding protein [Prevotella fusca JCM 17724]
MNERLVVKSFGPIRSIDINFRKVNLFIGDQGTGKSCIVKLYSTFRWLEKTLLTETYSLDYFTKFVDARFKKQLCGYHRIDDFFRNDTYILYESALYKFVYAGNAFNIEKKNGTITGLPKIMYVPAERIILSSAEKKLKTFDGLPASNLTFNQTFWESKERFKDGYSFPFGNLNYKYDSLNDISWIEGCDYRVRLINASSGIQSALPVCIVSDYLGNIVASGKERPMSVEELQKLQKETSKIMENENLSDSVKNAMLKHLSSRSRYNCFVNIVEEPELSLFPESQNSMIRLLCKVNNGTTDNMLLLTSHSPYTLAILNNLVLAYKAYEKGDDNIKRKVAEIVPPEYHIDPESLTAFSLTEAEMENYQSVLSESSGIISKNDLDSVSELIMREFNILYRIYGKTIK